MATVKKWSNVAIAMQSALASAKTITGITVGATATVTSTAHGYANGDYVLLTVQGMRDRRPALLPEREDRRQDRQDDLVDERDEVGNDEVEDEHGRQQGEEPREAEVHSAQQLLDDPPPPEGFGVARRSLHGEPKPSA